MNTNPPLGRNVNTKFKHRPSMALQDYPYFGNTEENATVILSKGWTSVDYEAGTIHVHDGVTPGGHVILNMAQIQDLIQKPQIVFRTLDEILGTTSPEADIIYASTDTDAMLTLNDAGKWCGTLGSFASIVALDAVQKTLLAGGRVTAYVQDVGFTLLSKDASKWLYSLVAEMV